jgi:hypothetical protein
MFELRGLLPETNEPNNTLHHSIMYRSREDLVQYLQEERPAVIVFGLDAHLIKDFPDRVHLEKIRRILVTIRRTLPGVKGCGTLRSWVFLGFDHLPFNNTISFWVEGFALPLGELP